MYFLTQRGYFREGREWLEQVLTLPEAAATADRAAVLRCIAKLEYRRSNFDAALPLLEESLSLCRALEDENGVAECLNGLGNDANARGNFADAQRYYEESLLYYRKHGHDAGIAQLLLNLSVTSCEQGDWEIAARYSLESSPFYSRHLEKTKPTNKPGYVEPLPIAQRARIAYYQGDFERAKALFDETLYYWRLGNNRAFIHMALIELTKVSSWLGDPGTARLNLAEAITERREMGIEVGSYGPLSAAAILSFAEGRLELAACLLGVIDAVIGKEAPLKPVERSELDALTSEVREALGEAAFVIAAGEGLSANPEDLLTRAVHGGDAAV
ncbi:MAG: tetratricopeptide repeat protein, partial [Armatimonadota bacterium]